VGSGIPCAPGSIRTSLSCLRSSAAAAVRDLCLAFVERAAARAVCIKPQSAFFEQLGPEGVHVLAEVMAAIRQAGCPALLDVKRGDIGSTGEAYALAYLDAAAPMPADALTLSPYLGLDSLEPFLARVRDAGRGIFVLVKTSNPGSGDFQDREVGGRPLFERVAEALAPAAKEAVGPQTGWSSLGVVVGATYPEQAEAVRALLPHSLLLVPGYGAQGASAADVAAGFTDGLRGALVRTGKFQAADLEGDVAPDAVLGGVLDPPFGGVRAGGDEDYTDGDSPTLRYDDEVADLACRYLREGSWGERPFLLLASFFGPHPMVGRRAEYRADYEAYLLGASRSLGSGVSWDVYYAYMETNNGAVAGNPGIDGNLLATAINLSF